MPRRLGQWRWWKKHRRSASFVILTVIYVATLVWIQHGRLVSCRASYEGVREVFHPFLTPPPKPGEGKRYRDYVTFNNRVNELKANCSGQIRLWWP